jgi:hypothetical protein
MIIAVRGSAATQVQEQLRCRQGIAGPPSGHETFAISALGFNKVAFQLEYATEVAQGVRHFTPIARG